MKKEGGEAPLERHLERIREIDSLVLDLGDVEGCAIIALGERERFFERARVEPPFFSTPAKLAVC